MTEKKTRVQYPGVCVRVLCLRVRDMNSQNVVRQNI